MNIRILISLLLSGITAISHGQFLKGYVYEKMENEQPVPLTGVNVYWMNTTRGTVTDKNGYFEILKEGTHDHILVFSYVGYISDTVHVHEPFEPIEIYLLNELSLDEVTIHGKQKGSHLDRMSPIHTQVISGAGLQQAACCNLSESFENSATVDVNYTDALTGAKQIELLGLAGVYSQMMTENIPNLRGLSSTFGLAYVPGSWMESIQVSKGTSSVVNGFESVTGQINIEYKKPEDSEKFFLNFYANHFRKAEANLNSSVKLSDKWSTMVLAHGERKDHSSDINGDGFIDMPLMKQYNLMNRWKYQGTRGLETRFGFSVLGEERTGGELRYNSELPSGPANGYGISLNTLRVEGYNKTGFVFQNRHATSLGFITHYSHHRQSSLYGFNTYEGRQNSLYMNLIFQSFIGDTRHEYRTGISLMNDRFDEKVNHDPYQRTETIPGIFFQYTWKPREDFTLMTGIRADWHNQWGLFYTPRLHLRTNITPSATLRASAGRGFRTANVFAEHSFLLASSRVVEVQENPGQEKAWNYGLTLSQRFPVLGTEWTFSAEYHRTDFQNQVVVDVYRDPSAIYIYNLQGPSWSNSLQLNLNASPFTRFDVVLGYRLNDVKTTIDDELVEKPLVKRHKGLVNLSYATRLSKWQCDFTWQYNGGGRLTPTDGFPPEYRRPDRFNPYSVINAQITRRFRYWNIYLGTENLGNFRQADPILAWDDPFGPYFDASMVWGPIEGRKIYAGIRIHID
ncbi:MAG TPA: TonB-dependent receptor [Bacteroidetes bacterium]|nr:TonB-dependent receptor [Bacteroidota bacterium]